MIDKNKASKESDCNISWKTLFLIALTAWGLYGAVVLHFADSMSNAGLFGDMFGGINALFSGLALIGVVVAVLYQRSELKLQREELKLTRLEMENQRGEMKGQKQHLSKQAETLAAQKYADTFFSMLRMHLDENAGIIGPTGLNQVGVIGKRYFADKVDYINRKAEKISTTEGIPKDEAKVRVTVNQLATDGGILDSHFQRLEALLSYIELASTPEEREIYSNTLKSHMTGYERTLLAWFMNHDKCPDRLKALAGKYNLFTWEIGLAPREKPED